MLSYLSGHRAEPEIERPFGMQHYREMRYPGELPYWAPSGWRLVALVSAARDSNDPYVLYDQWGKILHVWEQEYPPSYVDVLEVCTKLLTK
jgi:hypothetical protein